MIQFTFRGILINADSFQEEFITISFEEAKRLVTTIADLPIKISAPRHQLVSRENINDFRCHEYKEFTIQNRKVNEIQILIHGIVVNARALRNRYIEISFQEAERILRATQDLPFKIIGSYDALTIENIDKYRRHEDERFYIQPLNKTEMFNTADIEDEFKQVGLKCIEHIKAHLKRLGGFIDYEEENYREEVLFPKTEMYSVKTLNLVNDEVEAEIFKYDSYTKTLSQLFLSQEISVDELYSILKGLRDMKDLEIQHLHQVYQINA